MTENALNPQPVAGFSIPPRTKCQIKMIGSTTIPSLSRLPIEIPLQPEGTLEYECSDCGFKTNAVNTMEEHQEHQEKYHTKKQRLLRWLDLNIINLVTCIPYSFYQYCRGYRWSDVK
jgi:hypothetical protein